MTFIHIIDLLLTMCSGSILNNLHVKSSRQTQAVLLLQTLPRRRPLTRVEERGERGNSFAVFFMVCKGEGRERGVQIILLKMFGKAPHPRRCLAPTLIPVLVTHTGAMLRRQSGYFRA